MSLWLIIVSCYLVSSSSVTSYRANDKYLSIFGKYSTSDNSNHLIYIALIKIDWSKSRNEQNTIANQVIIKQMKSKETRILSIKNRKYIFWFVFRTFLFLIRASIIINLDWRTKNRCFFFLFHCVEDVRI